MRNALRSTLAGLALLGLASVALAQEPAKPQPPTKAEARGKHAGEHARGGPHGMRGGCHDGEAREHSGAVQERR